MFLGATNLYINDRNAGTIRTIRPAEKGYIFEMHDGAVYTSEKITQLDILIGAGDKITIEEEG